MVKANFTFNYYIYLYLMCGLKYIITIFWGIRDLAMCNCGAANIYIDTLSRWMYIYAKNTINMYAWTLYTPIHDFICYALNPFDIFKSFNIYIYIFRFYIASCAYTSTTMYTPIDEYGSCIRPGGSANIWKCTQGAVRVLVCPMMIIYWYPSWI